MLRASITPRCAEPCRCLLPGAPRGGPAVTGLRGGGRWRSPLPALYLSCGGMQSLHQWPGPAGLRGTSRCLSCGLTPPGVPCCRGTQLRLHGGRGRAPGPLLERGRVTVLRRRGEARRRLRCVRGCCSPLGAAASPSPVFDPHSRHVWRFAALPCVLLK